MTLAPNQSHPPLPAHSADPGCPYTRSSSESIRARGAAESPAAAPRPRSSTTRTYAGGRAHEAISSVRPSPLCHGPASIPVQQRYAQLRRAVTVCGSRSACRDSSRRSSSSVARYTEPFRRPTGDQCDSDYGFGSRLITNSGVIRRGMDRVDRQGRPPASRWAGRHPPSASLRYLEAARAGVR